VLVIKKNKTDLVVASKPKTINEKEGYGRDVSSTSRINLATLRTI
jgi:hypothetical protein